jgi:hypothetical protein
MPMKRLLPLVLLAACAVPVADAMPRSVKLTDQRLELLLADGTRCSVDWRKSPIGRMERCGPGYGYAVTVEDNPNILRQLVEGIVLALGGDGILAPMAEVVITGPGGTDMVYTSPARPE